MKKILAIALAALMIAAMAVPAFADNIELSSDVGATFDGEGQQTVIKYGVSESYTVTIPAELTLDPTEATDMVIAASKVKIAGNKQLEVKISSTQYNKNGDNKWTLVDTNEVDDAPVSDDVIYFIKKDSVDVVSASTVVLTVESIAQGTTGDTSSNSIEGNEGSVTLKLSTPGTAQVGNYEDKLTISVAIAANT